METTEDSQKIIDFVQKAFDYSESPAEDPKFLNSLKDFIRISNLSPLFDAEWNSNGLLMQACNHLKDFADNLGLQGYSSEIFKEDNLTPLLFLKLDPFIKTEAARTVLCYSHMDKQPWGDGWDADKSPTEPVVQNGKLYGRGGADDGYGAYSALWAVKACQENGLPHPRIYIFIEGAEESKEEDLIFYVNKFVAENKFEHPLDLVIALDSMTPSSQLFTSTASLRGIINFNLTVEAFKDNIHSGNSGIFADTFTVATDLIRRLEDKETYLMNNEFQIEIPSHRLEEIKFASFVGKVSTNIYFILYYFALKFILKKFL